MKNLKTEGIILGRRNIGEADRLLNIYTQNFGKIKVVARGSRKIKSKLASHIEPFNIGSYEFIEGKTFYILTGAESLHYVSGKTDCLDDFKDISYALEIVDIAMEEHEPQPAFYNILKESLLRLSCSPNEKKELILLYLEVGLLSALGYKPSYSSCRECQKPLMEESHYQGSYEGFLCSKCDNGKKDIAKSCLKLLRIINEKSLSEALTVNVSPEVILETKKIVWVFMSSILSRAPRSLEL